MSYGWLHDLVDRLVVRDEPDAAELVAHQAGLDHEILFDAADAAGARGDALPSQRGRWAAIQLLLEDAAVVSLRSHIKATEASIPNNAFGTTPRVPHVTVDMDVINARVDEGDLDAFLAELLKATTFALQLAGEKSARNHLLGDAKGLVNQRGYDQEALLLLVAEYVTLR